jgi:acyl transferase domain-containing protein
MDDPSSPALDGVAIIGMAGRFPGARGLAEFWSNLRNGVESIRRFSDEELLATGVPASLLSDPSYVRARAVLDDVEMFDFGFFGMTPREAELTDPQQRLFIECCWEALQDAGVEAGGTNAGVFAGCSLNTYMLGHVLGRPGEAAQFLRGFQVEGYPVLVGNDKDYLATRVAYKLNLRGPALTIQTACSTSLVAVSQAVAALNTYQCDLALAGGVSISFPQTRGYRYEEGSIASADGHCRAFDAEARGTVFGAGCGVVLLKRLAEALADGDPIYAVIKGAALNNDGSAKQSFMAPSPDGQAEVIALAQALAGVSADTVSYIEAHGTGTPVGDPIEVAGLTQAFRATTDRTEFCWLGTAKSNFGHLEIAAGVTGLIKTALALQHRELPPTLHYQTPNPNIDFAATPFKVVSRLEPWEGVPLPRRAGVSSFGVGGTNAHVVLEEAPVVEPSGSSRPQQLMLVSARSSEALDRSADALAARLAEGGEPAWFADAAFTLMTGRRAFPHRCAVVAPDAAAAAERLSAGEVRWMVRGEERAQPPEVAFLFPGQGSQHVNMGRELRQTEPVFRDALEECARLLAEPLGLDLLSVLHPDTGDEERAQEALAQTQLAQPALFAIEYALARLWMSWGIRPAVLVGHSVGEYVAAVLAGVMPLGTALSLIAARSRLMQSQPPGSMLSVRLPEEELRAELDEALAIGVINTPRACVVSGPAPEVAALKARLQAKGVACKPLHTSHAFHSRMMEPVLEAFEREVRAASLGTSSIPAVSTLTGRWIRPEDWAEPGYWSRQLRHTVRFSDAVAALADRPGLVLLEVGPGQVLSILAQQHPARPKDQSVIPSLPPPGQSGETESLLLALGKLWTFGVSPDWQAFHAGQNRRRVHLPAFALDRQRCWMPAAVTQPMGESSAPRHEASLNETILFQLNVMMEQLDRFAERGTADGMVDTPEADHDPATLNMPALPRT